MNEIVELFHEIPAMFPLTGVAVFLYGLAYSPPLAVIMGGVLLAFVVLTRQRWILRLFITVILVAVIHDALTGELNVASTNRVEPPALRVKL